MTTSIPNSNKKSFRARFLILLGNSIIGLFTLFLGAFLLDIIDSISYGNLVFESTYSLAISLLVWVVCTGGLSLIAIIPVLSAIGVMSLSGIYKIIGKSKKKERENVKSTALNQYVIELRAKGYTDEAIREILLQHGWKDDVIKLTK